MIMYLGSIQSDQLIVSGVKSVKQSGDHFTNITNYLSKSCFTSEKSVFFLVKFLSSAINKYFTDYYIRISMISVQTMSQAIPGHSSRPSHS